MRSRPILLPLVAVCLLTPALIWAQDIVYKNDGGRLRGKIVSETSRVVKIKTLGGLITLSKDEVLRIEREGDVFRAFERKKKKLTEQDSKGWFKLGVWAQDQELYPRAIDCFHHVISIDYDHTDARWELGYRRLKGRWVTESEYFEAKGYARWQDRWVSGEEYEKLEAGLVEVDGHWVTQEQADANRAERKTKKKKRKKKRRSSRRTKPDPGSVQASAKPRGFPGFPWAGRRPLGGQVGLPPLSEEEREAQLERNKARGSWALAHPSKYYDFYSNGPEAEVKKLAKVMDLMCNEYKRIFKFEEEITRPFPIHLYASQQEFMGKTGKGAGVGGFYDGRKIVGFHGKLGNLSTQSVLFHEGTHQFQGLVLGANMWRAKIWLIEGLAVFFEASEANGRRLNTSVIPKGRLGHVRRAVTSGSYVRLRDLIRMEQRQFGALHYAHAWSLIHFLVYGAKGGKKRFVQYWEGTKEGREGVQLFEELFNKPIEEIEAAWKEYVIRLQ